MTMNNEHIHVEANPAYGSTDVTEILGFPTTRLLGIDVQQTVDNFGLITRDPCNWFVFDPGNAELNNPTWASLNTVNGKTQIALVDPGAEFPTYDVFGSGSTLYSTGGPRNKGYANIHESTHYRINRYVPRQTQSGSFIDKHTDIWKNGSIEFTLMPNKQNCTILSGTEYGMDSAATSRNGMDAVYNHTYPPSKQFIERTVNNGSNQQVVDLKVVQGAESDIGYWAAWEYNGNTIIPTRSAGINLSNIEHTFRTFKVFLLNGILCVSYTVHYGPDQKHIRIVGKTNINDGQWHHVVINRPSPFDIKDGEQIYGGDGCIEIWVDGQLENRSFDITANDALPTPQMLFNDTTNAGIINEARFVWSTETSTIPEDYPWMVQAINNDGYSGGIRDFIFRQSTALSKNYIGLNYIYAMLNDDNSHIVKSEPIKLNAELIDPSINTNKKKVLKLYWNNLLKDKTKCLNGLEFDDTFDVFSYSTTKKNILSPTQTFNIDLNFDETEKTFLTNVKTAIGKYVHPGGPGIRFVPLNAGQQLDYTNPAMVSANSGIDGVIFVNNLLYGGVELSAGDRILLFNQTPSVQNGIWVYNGPTKALTRPSDISINNLKNSYVYVTNGKYEGKTFIQINNINNLRHSAQKWVETDNEVSIAPTMSYPIHSTNWSDEYGNHRFIDINNDIDIDYDIIAFMNYPTEAKEIVDSLDGFNEIEKLNKYKDFINSIKTAVNNGKSLFISSPLLAVDFGIVDKVTVIPQLLNSTEDAQAASISPFESGEAATNYFDTHRNNKYHLVEELAGLTDKTTYIMTDFVTYSPDRTKSDYHIKYSYRQFGLQEGDEFYIPGLTTLPETLNEQLPGYIYNQRGIKDFIGFDTNHINYGTPITKLSNNIYNGSNAVANPYDDYITTIAAEYGNGKIFVNCIEDSYAFSRLEYNKGIIQNVTAGQNSETVQTAAWQYSTKRLAKKDLYDFSEIANPIGQTTPTKGGGSGIVQAQSHCSNGFVRNKTNKDDLKYQSDLYPDFTEEVFATTEIPVLSMTWLGLQWLAE